MGSTKNFLAVDYGASNGRAIIGKFDGKKLILDEIHRFENRPVFLGGTFYWDFLRLFSELKNGISLAVKKYTRISSIGVETWGCDFGLLDSRKSLLSNPVHYRDKRTIGISKEIRKILSDWDIYERTQSQILEINTLYQLYYLKKNNSPILENARYFLLLGDLFNFFLTGEIICEFSNATLTQLLNQRDMVWEEHIIEKLGLPRNIFTDVMLPGKIIGKINRDVCDELACPQIKVALPCYDTTSEITAIPVSKDNVSKNWAYLNCGTWAMVGIISDEPIVKKEGFEQKFGNEGGFGGRYHYLKNMIGLWIIQQCRKKWMLEKPEDISWKDIDMLTAETSSSNIFIDVDDGVFERELFDMPSAVKEYCRKTGQDIPDGIGQMSVVIYESLALKYILNLKKLEKIISQKIELLHIVGGGSNNSLLCQWISDASGTALVAGPSETTTTGNILAQMVAAGSVSNIDEARQIMINSVSLKTYLPDNKKSGLWEDKFNRYMKVLSLDI